jgi:hypothetical protein
MSDAPAFQDRIPRPPGTPGAFGAPSRSDPLRQEIAAVAARLIAEAGLDYRSAKRKAAQQVLDDGRGTMSTLPRGALPDNAEVDLALREHLALFDDGHPARVARMRAAALTLMRRLEAFQPYLTGAVWKGIVAEHAPIHLQLFHDDVKDIEMRLLDDGLTFEVGEVPHFRGDGARADIEALMLTWHGEPAMLSLYSQDDLRGALRGVPAERGTAAEVERLLALTDEVDR